MFTSLTCIFFSKMGLQYILINYDRAKVWCPKYPGKGIPGQAPVEFSRNRQIFFNIFSREFESPARFGACLDEESMNDCFNSLPGSIHLDLSAFISVHRKFYPGMIMVSLLTDKRSINKSLVDHYECCPFCKLLMHGLHSLYFMVW